MKQKDTRELLVKFTSGLCTNEEKALVESWYLQWKHDGPELGHQKLEKAKKDIWQSLPPNHKIRNIPRWPRMVAAAVIFILSVTGLYFYTRISTGPQQPVIVQQQPAIKDLAPGGNRAVLTLGDGSTIILNDAKNGTLANQGNTEIMKLQNGQLIYNASNLPAVRDLQSITYNTISTPRGGQYHIILPDGSKVWLNAASSLRFPTNFLGKERSVILNGEAYFEVIKNTGMPFKVQVNSTEVEVLGTHFNIMAYQDESSINTTLLEGSVRVTHGKEAKVIMPGQQAIVKENITIELADTESAVAWKNGLTVFQNADIESIMRQISRWYDVDVVYQGEVPHRSFTGKIPRNVNVSKIFKVLELSNINFKVEDKKITVIP